ncbi:MAG: diguanylate cyclase, partial [Nitrospirota bacterium]|nr:diguanylate cyclase [Nitrospirota bacterium]
LEQIELNLLSLQEPLIVYRETGSYSQKIRFDTILQEIRSRLSSYAEKTMVSGSLLSGLRFKGMLSQIQALGNALFVPGIGTREREQLTLSLTNLLFETVHNDIRPYLGELRAKELSRIHQIFLLILFNLLFLAIELVLLLSMERPLRHYIEKSLLKPLENLSVWSRSVAKGNPEEALPVESFPKDVEIRDLVESIHSMKESLIEALGQTERKLQYNELLSMIIQASGFMSREEDILDVSRQALKAVFSGNPVEIYFQIKEEEKDEECWARRKGGLVSDQDWNGLVRCHQCAYANMEGTYLCSPIQSSDETIGTITLRTQEIVEWREETRAFLRDVAAHVGMSISKIRLLHRHRNEAILDPLTGLYNRRYLEDFFQRVASLIRRHEKPYSFIMMDIDHFKQINDKYGHETGDLVLRELSEIIRTILRQGEDMPARIGGEEFAMIVIGNRSQAFVVAEKIRKKVEVRWDGSQNLKVTVSAGLAEIGPEASLVEVMKEADDVLYRAKKEGRNRTIMAGGKEEQE